MCDKTQRHWQSHVTMSLALLSSIVMVLLLAGCGTDGPTMGKVTGKVLYKDGSVPTGGEVVIRFEPTADTNAEIRKAASCMIMEDGTYDLLTVKPGDGAIFGTYKVVFTILESYRTGVSLVDEKYTKAETTPFERVIDSSSHQFDFEIERAKGKRKQ